MNKIRLAVPLEKEDLINGEGIRMVLWCQGCNVHCKKCHNPETWNLCGGKEYLISDIKQEIQKYSKYHDGITLTGGDPFLQAPACLEIAKYTKEELKLNVWAYCGLTYEQILQDEEKKELLKYVDILIDGPYIDKERDITLKWRGSRNQRIIDVQQSLIKGETILYE